MSDKSVRVQKQKKRKQKKNYSYHLSNVSSRAKNAFCTIVRYSRLKTGSLYVKHVSDKEEEQQQEEDTILEDEFDEE